MMITHMDNFTVYGGNVALLLNGVYAANSGCSLVNDPDGISGGKVLRSLGQAISGARYVLPSLQTTVGVCSRTWQASLPSQNTQLPSVVAVRDASNSILASIIVETTGRLAAYKGARGTTKLGETANPVVTANGWYHVESKFVIDPLVGSITVRVEGIPVLTLTDLNLGSAPIAQLSIGDATSAPASAEIYFKDFVVWDSSGTYNNDFIGSVLVYNLTPLSDVALNWTPSTGVAGYPILDNIPPIDTEYLSAPNPAPAAYVCEVSDLPADVTSVKAVMTMVRAAKTDGGDAGLQIGVISDPAGTPATALGADRPITVAQTYWRDVFETDPVTSAPWLPTAVNEIRLQMNRTA